MNISTYVQERLSRLGLHNELDLILHLPVRYEDETCLCLINDAPQGRVVQIEGTIIYSEVMIRPKRQFVYQVEDSSGILTVRFLSFYGNQIKTYAIGKRVRLLGEIRMGYLGLEIIHPKCRIVHEGELLADTMTPIYATTTGLTQKTLGKLIGQVLQKVRNSKVLDETLPNKIIRKYCLDSLRDSVMCLHNPSPNVLVEALQTRTHSAWRRIKFDELLAQQLSMRLHYRQRRTRCAPVLVQKNKFLQQFFSQLPFQLTTAQAKVFAEISRDLAAPYPMQRLLQGDVGSGKTVVAALAALQAIENGFQVAILAPTEILAEQHFQKLSTWLTPLGIRVAWLSGSQKRRHKLSILDDISLGNTHLAVGTHALLQKQVLFHQLGLAIIDEQHRFGVHQRLSLHIKGSQSNLVPHQLMMSATPIPRTLSMSYLADLDVSIIDELPPGRSPIVTKLIADDRRDEIIARIHQACQQGKQVYWVCPLIEESEMLQLQTAIKTYERLNEIFSDLHIGLVHGRLHPKERAEVVSLFKEGQIQLLIATTVIEVGIDVPNASLMVIENAERMGLSQLHQLRGRVGRGSEASICILLFQQSLSQIARKRLKIIFEHTDGFEIARQDLQLRGPGEFLGSRQSGMPMLRFADLEQDCELLIAAQATAEEMLNEYPDLALQHIKRWLGDKTEYLRA